MKKIFILIIVVSVIVVVVMAIRVKNNVQTTTQLIKTEQNIAKDQQIKTDISRLRSALELYRADNGSYPSALSSLTPKYINPLPTNPYNSNSYSYTATESTYILSTSLGDGSMYSQKNP